MVDYHGCHLIQIIGDMLLHCVHYMVNIAVGSKYYIQNVTICMWYVTISAYYSVFDLCQWILLLFHRKYFWEGGDGPPCRTLHRHISMKGRYKANVHIHCSFRTPQLPETVVTTIKYLIQSTTLPELPETLFLIMMQLTILPSVCQSCLFIPATRCALEVTKKCNQLQWVYCLYSVYML